MLLWRLYTLLFCTVLWGNGLVWKEGHLACCLEPQLFWLMRDHGIYLFSTNLFLLLRNKGLGHGVASRSFKFVPEGSVPEMLKILYSSSLIGRWQCRKGQFAHRTPQIQLQFPHWPTSMGCVWMSMYVLWKLRKKVHVIETWEAGGGKGARKAPQRMWRIFYVLEEEKKWTRERGKRRMSRARGVAQRRLRKL